MGTKQDIAEKVTDAIIAALESGTVPWKKPWSVDGYLPTSGATGKQYRGFNLMLLSYIQQANGYEDPRWVTFRQAKARGGSVRKGEKGTPVIFWKKMEKTTQENGKDVTKKWMLLREYTVFNLAQTDGVELPPRRELPKREPVALTDGVKRVLAAYKEVPVKHSPSGSASYSPSKDIISLPKREQFATAEGYAETLFHEMVHSTGHKSRLNRHDEGACFGNAPYAKEELVAEMGATMLAAMVGVDIDIAQPAAYIKSWLRALKDDRTLLIGAAQQAQKATDYILRTEADANA